MSTDQAPLIEQAAHAARRFQFMARLHLARPHRRGLAREAQARTAAAEEAAADEEAVGSAAGAAATSEDDGDAPVIDKENGRARGGAKRGVAAGEAHAPATTALSALVGGGAAAAAGASPAAAASSLLLSLSRVAAASAPPVVDDSGTAAAITCEGPADALSAMKASPLAAPALALVFMLAAACEARGAEAATVVCTLLLASGPAGAESLIATAPSSLRSLASGIARELLELMLASHGAALTVAHQKLCARLRETWAAGAAPCSARTLASVVVAAAVRGGGAA